MRQMPVLYPPSDFDVWGKGKNNIAFFKAKDILLEISRLMEELPDGWSMEIMTPNNAITPHMVEADMGLKEA